MNTVWATAGSGIIHDALTTAGGRGIAGNRPVAPVAIRRRTARTRPDRAKQELAELDRATRERVKLERIKRERADWERGGRDRAGWLPRRAARAS
jgi:hypothetical protein